MKDKIFKWIYKERNNLILSLIIIFLGWIELLTLKGMREKIASFLMNESNERGSNMFQIMLNRTELSDYLNVSRTSMCRELARMKDEGLIDYYGNSFKVIDKERLGECLE